MRKMRVDRRINDAIKRTTNNLDRLYVNKEGEDIVSKLRMRCCNGFINWNGTGMKGLVKAHLNCPLCDAILDTRKAQLAENREPSA